MRVSQQAVDAKNEYEPIAKLYNKAQLCKGASERTSGYVSLMWHNYAISLLTRAETMAFSVLK